MFFSPSLPFPKAPSMPSSDYMHPRVFVEGVCPAAPPHPNVPQVEVLVVVKRPALKRRPRALPPRSDAHKGARAACADGERHPVPRARAAAALRRG